MGVVGGRKEEEQSEEEEEGPRAGGPEGRRGRRGTAAGGGVGHGTGWWGRGGETKRNQKRDTHGPKLIQPDVAPDPELSAEENGRTRISDDFLRKLSAQQEANARAQLHRGGNLRRPVDFEEALKVTVPYEKRV